jgi:hypothetical protein
MVTAMPAPTARLPRTGAALAYVATHAESPTRRRRDARIGAVLSEFGFSTYLGGGQLDRLARIVEAQVVVCDLVRPERDIPVEVAIAATRGIPVIALVPAGVRIEGTAADLLADCAAQIVRYARAEPHHVLHARLGEMVGEAA